jgi:hypothetical protein
MSTERPEFSSAPARSQQITDDNRAGQNTRNPGPTNEDSRYQSTAPGRSESVGSPETPVPPKDSSGKGSSPSDVTVVVRGEAVRNQDSPSQDSKPTAKSPPKKVSEAKVKKQSLLPALDDDSDVGVQKDQVVTRDGKADLAFTGTLQASAAPSSAPQGRWQEYRVYQTSGGKHVFSKISRSIYAGEQDQHKAEVFDPAPSSMPSQLLRGARDLVHAEALTWKNAASDFFGYDPLAKALYRKLGDEFEEHIS